PPRSKDSSGFGRSAHRPDGRSRAPAAPADPQPETQPAREPRRSSPRPGAPPQRSGQGLPTDDSRALSRETEREFPPAAGASHDPAPGAALRDSSGGKAVRRRTARDQGSGRRRPVLSSHSPVQGLETPTGSR